MLLARPAVPVEVAALPSRPAAPPNSVSLKVAPAAVATLVLQVGTAVEMVPVPRKAVPAVAMETTAARGTSVSMEMGLATEPHSAAPISPALLTSVELLL